MNTPLRLSRITLVLASLLALGAAGCRTVDCGARNVAATGVSSIESTPSFSRSFELTLSASAASDLEYRDRLFLMLDTVPEVALPADQPIGTFDVLVTISTDSPTSDRPQFQVDLRDGIEIGPTTLLSDCPETGECVRTMNVEVQWAHSETPPLLVDWTARVISDGCAEGADIVVRDVTPTR